MFPLHHLHPKIKCQQKQKPSTLSDSMAILNLFLIFLSLSPAAASVASASPVKSSFDPFTAKAALIRYWNRKIPNSPIPLFLAQKFTPLSIAAAAKFSNIAAIDPSKLSQYLPSFCSSAGLLCYTNPALSLSSQSGGGDSSFAGYDNRNFTNYATDAADGLSSFTNYSGNEIPFSTFRRYGRDSAAHDDTFTVYGPRNIDAAVNFTSYGTNTTIGTDKFTSYGESTNSPALSFTSYAADATGRASGFTHYSDNANVGTQSFSSYGKSAKSATSDFISYAYKFSNIISSEFTNYAEDGKKNKETFTSYSVHGNIPDNVFQTYGSNSDAGVDKFTTYRAESNIGSDTFISYEKGGHGATAAFSNYGNSSSGTDAFRGYGEGSGNDHITFKSYVVDKTTFKAYAKTGVNFKSYHNSSSAPTSAAEEKIRTVGMNRWVEAGKFFRESNLKKGTVMPMPDISDRMAPRSFLPRTIAEKIPFNTSVAEIFEIPPGTAMEKAVSSTLGDCKRPPSRGETKRCVTSAEDMIDFALSVLGGDVAVRSTANTKGSRANILIGEVKGVNGGKVTQSISCHQSLYPFLVYYCHSVPRVRVYEAEILAVDSKEKINHGIAICHVDTSDWSSTHGAFVALGPGPGKIEVCHWIFEGDMSWTVADRS